MLATQCSNPEYTPYLRLRCDIDPCFIEGKLACLANCAPDACLVALRAQAVEEDVI